MEEEKSSKYKTISSDIEVDSPPYSIQELKEIILNMQYAHTKQLEAISEQITAMEDRLRIKEDDFTESLY
jgi:hypothetical protein